MDKKYLELCDESIRRIAIENTMDNCESTCFMCDHKWQSIDDFIDREPIFISNIGNKFRVACKKCYEGK